MLRAIHLFILSTTLVVTVLSECCKHTGKGSCCGVQQCNIFCCNCDGGCKSPDDCTIKLDNVVGSVKKVAGAAKEVAAVSKDVAGAFGGKKRRKRSPRDQIASNNGSTVTLSLAQPAATKLIGKRTVEDNENSQEYPTLDVDGQSEENYNEDFADDPSSRFHSVDLNNDGYIDMDEAIEYLRSNGYSEDDVMRELEELDFDSDGVINQHEFDDDLD